MTLSADCLDGAARFRRRPELIAQPTRVQGRRCWNVKDPLTLRYYQLREEEYFVLSQLDGETSLEQIRAGFEERFAPQRIEPLQLNWFLGMLHRQSLVIADSPNQGQHLLERRRLACGRRRWGRLANLLAIRFRGIDPSGLLNLLYPCIRWVFSPFAVMACVMLIAAALLWAVLHAEAVSARLPHWSAFLQGGHLLWLVVALVIAKCVHELAHALTCQHFGGNCRELGIMLLVFTPCLYCNVSDAWMIPSKWRRMAISGAGIFAELVLAAGAFFVWWSAAPGVLSSVCLSLIVVCSWGTILFNANPLLRYDGYFLLSDWLEIPNLYEQAAEFWQRRIAAALGVILPESPLAAGQSSWLLAIYGFAASLYKWLLVFGILWSAQRVFAVYRLEWAAYVLAAAVLPGMVVNSLAQLSRCWQDPQHRRQVRLGRAAVAFAVLAGCVAGLCSIPLPYRVVAPAILQPATTRKVYVAVPGRLVWAVAEGSHVRSGDPIAQLESPTLPLEVAELQSRCRSLELEIEYLESLTSYSSRSRELAAQLPAHRDALRDYQQRLGRRMLNCAELMIRSPASGVVMAASSKPEENHPEWLETWAGSPLDERNRGSYLDSGTQLCDVGDPQQFEALVIVPEHEVAFLAPGQPVLLRLSPWLAEDLVGEVCEVVPTPVRDVPEQLAAAGLVAMAPRAAADRPLVPSYEVRVQLAADSLPLISQAAGHARISGRPRSIAGRLRAFWARTFAAASRD